MHSRLLFGWLMLGVLSLHALMPSSYVYKAPFSSFPHFPNQVPPLTQQLGTPPVLHVGHDGIGLVGAGFFVGLLLTGGLLAPPVLAPGFGFFFAGFVVFRAKRHAKGARAYTERRVSCISLLLAQHACSHMHVLTFAYAGTDALDPGVMQKFGQFDSALAKPCTTATAAA